MRLTIFTGSPKPGKNNTELLVDKLAEGFKETGKNDVEFVRMNKTSTEEMVTKFKNAETVLLAFPLYVYAMPGGVKEFIEAIEPLCGKCSGKKLGFLVQYGFTEAIHARPLEKYLERLAEVLGCEYIGMIIKGGCDGLSRMPASASKKIFNGIYEMGKTLGDTGRFDKNQIDEYSKPETQKKQNKFLLGLMLKLINKFYWEGTFKKNGVTREASFAKPYGE